MKIAYMNPWEYAAESQAYLSLAAGAAKLEIELIDCRVAEDIESARPDFVISVASSIPKVADYPSYLTLHEPRRRFLENDFYMKNLLSYDGFLTIRTACDVLQRTFVLAWGVKRKWVFTTIHPKVRSCVPISRPPFATTVCEWAISERTGTAGCRRCSAR